MTFLPSPDNSLVIVAFEGWNDAGEVATDCARHLIEEWGLEDCGLIGGEEFYDFGYTRPTLRRHDDGAGWIDWPSTRRYTGIIPGKQVPCEVILGTEPSFNWRKFMGLLLDLFTPGDRVVLLGSLLADTPHTRPIPVITSVEDPAVAEMTELPMGSYAGPTGILGALAVALADEGIASVQCWTAVPNYAAAPPSPKAQIALLGAVEELTGLLLEQQELVEEAEAWEAGADALVEEDDDLAAYVAQLEHLRDAADLPEATGDAIAEEFERYLKRKRPDKDPGPDWE